jgi:hypothetical protein
VAVVGETQKFGWVLFALATAMILDVSVVILVPILVSIGTVFIVMGRK